MKLLFNDLSINGQFLDISLFLNSIDSVMKMREIVQQYGRELYCHRNIMYIQVTRSQTMPQVLQNMDDNKRKALLQWITRFGCCWDDERMHSPNDYLECDSKIVTDTAIGEAGFRCLHGNDDRLVSLTPSDWISSPLPVCWFIDESINKTIEIINYIDINDLEAALKAVPKPIETWEQLSDISKIRFPHLTFASYTFDSLKGYPFYPGVADRIIERLYILEQLKNDIDIYGVRTKEANRIYSDYFSGEKAWFSDSSTTEKSDFEKEMTFKHPSFANQTLFCSWHGKIKTPQFRIHFSWPIQKETPLYIVYIGPKITKY